MPKFFETFEDGSGLSFVGQEEKETLIEDQTTLAVLRVSKSNTKYGERFITVVELDGEERALSFSTGSVESRDRLLDSLMEYLNEDDAETPLVFLERVGRSILIRNAEETE